MSAPIAYIPRMLELHAEQPPYRWAEPGSLPRAAPVPHLSNARTVLVSLAGIRRIEQRPYQLRGDTMLRLVPVDADPAGLVVEHFGYKLARAQADIESVAPFAALRALAADGVIGAVAPDAVCCMGASYSQRRVTEELVPAIVNAVQQSGADLALIVPACPLDHQTAALVARGVEMEGTATLVLSGARDISERVGASRTVYVHAPLGWLLGMPGDREGQRARLEAALEAGVALPGDGRIADLPPAYPTGAWGTPDALAQPDLLAWEDREYRAGYDTGATRG